MGRGRTAGDQLHIEALGPQGGGGQFNFTRGIESHTDYVVWMLNTLRERGAGIVDIKQEPEIEYAEHCRLADLNTRPLRDCISYYNGEGNAEPGSLAYYGGPQKWHEIRTAAQQSLEPYVFAAAPEAAPSSVSEAAQHTAAPHSTRRSDHHAGSD